MHSKKNHSRKIAVVGLGYVGLPLAVEFGKICSVIGFDKNKKRIHDLQHFIDHTNETSSEELKKSQINFTDDPKQLKEADFFIIAVPTPVDHANTPDLTLICNATQTVAEQLKKGDIVVFESTVYPGTTEEICAPILEKHSQLKCGKDFKIGYSPERINPSDKEHTLPKVIKIVSGQDQESLDIISDVYSSIIQAGVYRASSIQVAEAAKVIENTQRDLNIALINELALIFHRMGIDTQEVLAAAETKWNFLPFKPGLVGGHCIGVDPYYLTHRAQEFGYTPEVILAGRRINDSMGKYIAQETIKLIIQNDIIVNNARVAVLGLTFKENCPDLRNSRSFDIVDELKGYGIEVIMHDPIADQEEASDHYQVKIDDWKDIKDLDAIIISVSHDYYKGKEQEFAKMLKKPGCIVDVKSILDRSNPIFKNTNITLWRL